MTALRIGAAVLLAAAAVALSSCAGATDHPSPGSPASARQSSAHNQDDVSFAQLMIPHHQQAIELANLVPERSANPDVIRLAATIAAAQQPQIDTMAALLRQWGASPAETPHESTTSNLRGLTGTDFDILWLTSMIGHHQGAVAMADVEAGVGKNPEMTALARSIITAQQAEIDQMTKMLQSLVR